MAVIGLKRSLLSNTSCFSNLYLSECFRKYKFKRYLNYFLMTIGKNISLTKKKLDYLEMKMCKGVLLRRVKVKGLAHIRQLRGSTIPTDLSSKHEVCFMMKFTFKVMDTCLWYLDNGCSRHMTGDQSLFKVFESKKGGNVTFGDGSKSQIKGKVIISLPGLPNIANVLYVKSLRVNLLSISQICDQDFMVLFSKGKCLVMNESRKKLTVVFAFLTTIMDWFLMLILCVIPFVCQMKIYGINEWDMLATNIFLLYLSMSQF